MIGFNEYQKFTNTTAIYPKDNYKLALGYLALGLVGEAGEVSEKVKKLIRGDKINHGEFKQAVLKEMGDVLYYLAQLAEHFEMPLAEVAAMNVCKLKQRAENDTLRGEGDER